MMASADPGHAILRMTEKLLKSQFYIVANKARQSGEKIFMANEILLLGVSDFEVFSDSQSASGKAVAGELLKTRLLKAIRRMRGE